MRRRLTPLLLILALALQGVLPAWAHAAAAEGMQHHCDGHQVPADKCPHCSDAGMALFGCGNSCAGALAMPVPELHVADNAHHKVVTLSSKPLLSRSSAPPTPPPIS